LDSCGNIEKQLAVGSWQLATIFLKIMMIYKSFFFVFLLLTAN